MNSPVDPRDIHGGDWEVFEVTPEYRRSRLWISDTQYIMRTEFLEDEELVALNKQEFDDSATKRFGDGRVVARVPLNKFYREIAPRLTEGDRDYTKWWLNHPDNRPFRTFRGRI